jgi:hypothetical protein
LQKALCIIENFEKGSGLAVNQEKSEILELGIKSNDRDSGKKDFKNYGNAFLPKSS